MDKPKHVKRKPKVTKVVGSVPDHNKEERSMTAPPIFKIPYGKNNLGRNAAASSTFKKAYGQKLTKEPIKPRCRKCKDGLLERRQWNMLNCTNIKCDHKELQ